MQIHYTDSTGSEKTVLLGDSPVIIGREPDCQLPISDTKASRRHCEIRLWAGDYVLKDLNSKNGTFLNDQPAHVAVLEPGDKIRIGSTIIRVENKSQIGEETALKQIEHEMEEGKGYRTILRRIVDDIESTKDSTKKPPADG